MKKAGLSNITRIIILMAFYVVAGLAGKYFTFESDQVTLVWPSYGIGLAAILMFGSVFWPGVALGALVFSLVTGITAPALVISTMLGSTIGALVCAFLLERWTGFRTGMERVRDVAGFVGFACALGTTVNATFNAVGQMLAGQLENERLFSAVLSWWVPNAMAGLIITPVMLTFGSIKGPRWTSARVLEASLCGLGLLGGTLISFQSWYTYGIQNYPLAYLPYPFLVWGSLRFGPRGAAGGTFLVTLLAIEALSGRRGPFVSASEHESLVLIGSYLSVLSITNLLLAAAAAEREAAERAVRESERRYRAVVEDQTDLITRFDAQGTLTFVNGAHCRFHGRQQQELLGTYFLTGIPETDREIPLMHLGQLTSENSVVSFDFKVNRNSGEFLWQQSTIRRLFNENGQTLEFQSVTQDITRRKLAEESIRAAEARLRLVLTSMVDGVIVTDADGCILLSNTTTERIFQRPACAINGRKVDDLLGPAGATAVRESFQRQLHVGQHLILETELTGLEGGPVPIDISATEARLDDVTILRVIVIRDISERRRMEAQVRQAQKMDAVGRLAGGISHDFNNIMQAIMGYTHLLQTSLDPTGSDFRAVEQIERSAERAAALTNQLLAFSRKQISQPQAISLNAVVVEMQQLLQRLIGEQIKLDVHCNERVCLIRADPMQMGQIILNLALNARDAMPSGGSLRIRTAVEALVETKPGFTEDFQPGTFAVLTVADSGTGMTPDVIKHLFEPFFTTKEVGRGTGLGLSIVYGIVRQSHGQISVQTSPGEGSTFQVFLPEHTGPLEPAAPAPRPSVATGGSETILLVEDSDAVRAMLVELLKLDGYRVIEAHNGEEAIIILNRADQKIDLLLTDVVMPEMGGADVALAATSTRPGLPVLFMSGYTARDPGMEAGLDASENFLQKPFRPDLLLFKIRAVLDESLRQTRDPS